VRIIGDCIWTALLQTARRVFCCRGGELLDRLNEQKGAHYSEKVACNYVHTMLSAIRYGLQWDLPPICRAEGDDLLLFYRYCHSKNIVHRDLKLENFLFESDSPNSSLKLIGTKLIFEAP
jgi:calcium-dependent protein kinase